MTQIDFNTHLESKYQTVCALAGKALARGAHMMILTPDAEMTEKIDRMLWTHPPTAFLPHCRAHHKLARVTPIIVDHIAEPVVHEQILINLRSEAPPQFSRFERLLEIVGIDEADREQARVRFRFYRERGYEIRTHDLSAGAA